MLPVIPGKLVRTVGADIALPLNPQLPRNKPTQQPDGSRRYGLKPAPLGKARSRLITPYSFSRAHGHGATRWRLHSPLNLRSPVALVPPSSQRVALVTRGLMTGSNGGRLVAVHLRWLEGKCMGRANDYYSIALYGDNNSTYQRVPV